MKIHSILVTVTTCFIAFWFCACKTKSTIPVEKPFVPPVETPETIVRKPILVDSALIGSFFKSYPDLNKYAKEVASIYRQHTSSPIWFDDKGVNEFANSIYNKAKGIETEGVSSPFPYSAKIAGVFEQDIENTLSDSDTELMLTNLFLFYAEKVYKGIDDQTTISLGWFLPRKQVSYLSLLDSMLTDPKSLNRPEKLLNPQYFKLRDQLQRFRKIEKEGGWKPIAFDPKAKDLKVGDTAKAILQIRERLVTTGELKQNNHSNLFDSELATAIKKFQAHNGKNQTSTISPSLIQTMNIPVGELIKKIMVNMERCRWISPELTNAKEIITVNIPSFMLNLIRDGKSEFKCPVVVGKQMTKTVIFSGKMTYIVFSPYWNLPQSIINKEVKPGIAKDPNYLEAHNMEWNNGQVRQRPGKNNSLGLVKFIFPNSNDIYLHDTPAKSLFQRESRAFSHGCVRVGKPRDLALLILKDDPNWNEAKVDAAMHAGKESTYNLKNKIPVYIGYFTAWVDENGEINFYNDVYERDNRLTKLLME